jgi:hypothetical protein
VTAKKAVNAASVAIRVFVIAGISPSILSLILRFFSLDQFGKGDSMHAIL